MRPPTPSQTVGPYVALAMRWPADGRFVVPDGTPGAFWIRGRLLDGAGHPVDDGVVETWQRDAEGQFPAADEATFRGFGRSLTDREGSWAVHTVKPGRVADASGELAAPHVSIVVFARGLLKPVRTRMYFADEAVANDADGVLRSIDQPRRRTLIAQPTAEGYRFDLHLQGAEETVFFDV